MVRPSSRFRGQHALITGASSGIGEAFARGLAERGAHLILCARRVERLQAMAQVFREEFGCRVYVFESDLAKEDAPQALYRKTLEAGIPVDLLVNCAGVGTFGAFLDHPSDRYEQELRLNVVALTVLCRLFGKDMAERGAGGIINVSSTAAYQPLPLFSVYAATKTYVRSLSEALAQELKGVGVDVLVLCPGPTRTEFQKRSYSEKLLPDWGYASAERVVERALRDFERGCVVSVPGVHNLATITLARMIPGSAMAQLTGSLMKGAQRLRDKRSR